MTSRDSLIESISHYKTPYEEERLFIRPFEALLQHHHSFFRDHLPGHVTGSAWIIDSTRSWTLLTHHAKLNRWLQPGGHADGEEDIIHVALREAVEETGLRSLRIAGQFIFDLDIHSIPARNDFPEHLHYDVRILMEADRSEVFTITEESNELAWVPLQEVREKTGNNISMLRMAEKTGSF
jgi:8-oxo-dGTP pyrophosphatase MutT (NUDIX family)